MQPAICCVLRAVPPGHRPTGLTARVNWPHFVAIAAYCRHVRCCAPPPLLLLLLLLLMIVVIVVVDSPNWCPLLAIGGDSHHKCNYEGYGVQAKWYCPKLVLPLSMSSMRYVSIRIRKSKAACSTSCFSFLINIVFYGWFEQIEFA